MYRACVKKRLICFIVKKNPSSTSNQVKNTPDIAQYKKENDRKSEVFIVKKVEHSAGAELI